MKTKKIIEKLEKLFGKSSAQKSTEKQLESVRKLISELELKENKFRDKLDVLKSESRIPALERKLSVTQTHIAKAKAYIEELQS